MEVDTSPDIYGFTDYFNYDDFDEKIDDLLAADFTFEKGNVSVYEASKSIPPAEEFTFNSGINPDDFLNDGEVEDAFTYSDRSSPPLSNSSSSPTDNLKQESSSDVDSVNLESCIASQPIAILPDTRQIHFLQGALIPVSTVKIETKPSRISPSQSIALGANRFGRAAATTKTVLPKLPCDGKIIEHTQRPGLANDRINDRVLKKQQRMIKNRESASLSRRKKKEYVVSLELKIKSLVDENTILRNENINLRAQIMNGTQTTCSCTNNQFRYFNKSILTQNRKQTAMLLVMIFMVSMSFGNIQTFFAVKNSASDQELASINLSPHVGRGLLWAQEMSPPDDDENSLKNVSSEAANFPICPFSVNQTENIRIENQLRNWIGVSENVSTTQTDQSDDHFNYVNDFSSFKPNIKNLYKAHKYYFKRKNPHLHAKSIESMIKKRFSAPSAHKQNIKSHVQLFNPIKRKRRFSKLFEEIGIRDDTFYVLSFNSDHVLLSAASHNTSTRPKISYLLPTDDSFPDDKMTFIQIDCEVINTTVIQLKKEYIPDHLRTAASKENGNAQKNNTGQYKVRNRFEIFEMASRRAHRRNELDKIYKPYFIDKSNFAKDSSREFGDVFIP